MNANNIKEHKSRESFDDTQHVKPNDKKPLGHSQTSSSIKYDSDADVYQTFPKSNEKIQKDDKYGANHFLLGYS